MSAVAALSLLVISQYSVAEMNWQENHPGYTIVGSSTIQLPLTENAVSFLVTEPDLGVVAVDQAGAVVDARVLLRSERTKRLAEFGPVSDETFALLSLGDDTELLDVAIYPRVSAHPLPDRSRGEQFLISLSEERANSDLAGLRSWLGTLGPALFEVRYPLLTPVAIVRAKRVVVRELLGKNDLVDWIEPLGGPKFHTGVAEDTVGFPTAYSLGVLGSGQAIGLLEAGGKPHISPSDPSRWWNAFISKEPSGATQPGGVNAVLNPNKPDVLGNRYSNDQHATRVAATAASTITQFNGVTFSSGAPAAKIFGANPVNVDDDFEFLAGWEWLQRPARNSRVVNNSFGVTTYPARAIGSLVVKVRPMNPNFLDQVADQYSRNLGTTFVVGSGNVNSSVVGWLSYNTISVGGINPRGTVSWLDDTSWRERDPTTGDLTDTGTSYLNPPSSVSFSGTSASYSYGDRELPEMVAVATSRTTVENVFPEPTTASSSNTGSMGSGTSYAAPQVAGTAALLMERAPELRVWPEAVKAILLSSAVNPVRGTNPGARTLDFQTATGRFYQKDAITGVGALVASEAVKVASFQSGRYYFGSFSPLPNGALVDSFRFPVCKQRMRIALAYSVSYSCNFCFSDLHPPAPGEDGFPEPKNRVDRPRTTIVARSESGQLLATSRSLDNNYQILDFKSPAGRLVTVDLRGVAGRPEYYGIAMYCYDEASGLPVVQGID